MSTPLPMLRSKAVTSPYNADFDGDEMNLHLAQVLNLHGSALYTHKAVCPPDAVG